MTRADLLTTLARRLGKNASSLDASTQSRFLEFLNETHRDLLSGPGMEPLRRETVTLASVADQATYGLANAQKVNRVWETTNDRTLYAISLDEYRRFEPDPAAVTGTPEAFCWLGYSPVAAQPSDASELFVKSSSASDTTQTAYLEGEITGGYPRTASVTLTGTTAVTLAAAITTWVRVTKVYLSATAVGIVTLHEDSGSGTELARIGIGQTMQRYLQLALWPTPATAITYTADVLLDITDLAQSTDEPRLPHDFHDLLVYGAMAREYEYGRDDRLAVALGRYQQRRAALQYWLAQTATATLGPGAQAGMERSLFSGSYYPAARW